MTTKINVKNKQLKDCEYLEEIICLSVLISHKILPHDATNENVNEYTKEFMSCDDCPCVNDCLACIINE